MNYRSSIIGSFIALVLATSCCWLPALIIALGGGSALLGLSSGLEGLSGLFIVVGIALLGYGIYQYQRKSSKKQNKQVILLSTITCPACGHKKEEMMPTDACQFFYECEQCKKVLKPNKGDCCVYCSYGSVACPPIQLDQDCC